MPDLGFYSVSWRVYSVLERIKKVFFVAKTVLELCTSDPGLRSAPCSPLRFYSKVMADFLKGDWMREEDTVNVRAWSRAQGDAVTGDRAAQSSQLFAEQQ